jgi:hypothetical protein
VTVDSEGGDRAESEGEGSSPDDEDRPQVDGDYAQRHFFAPDRFRPKIRKRIAERIETRPEEIGKRARDKSRTYDNRGKRYVSDMLLLSVDVEVRVAGADDDECQERRNDREEDDDASPDAKKFEIYHLYDSA